MNEPTVKRQSTRVLMNVGVESRGDVQRIHGTRDGLIEGEKRPRGERGRVSSVRGGGGEVRRASLPRVRVALAHLRRRLEVVAVFVFAVKGKFHPGRLVASPRRPPRPPRAGPYPERAQRGASPRPRRWRTPRRPPREPRRRMCRRHDGGVSDGDVKFHLGAHRPLEETNLLRADDGGAERGHGARGGDEAALHELVVELGDAHAESIAATARLHGPLEHLHALHLLFQLQVGNLDHVSDLALAAQHRPGEHRSLALDREAVIDGEQKLASLAPLVRLLYPTHQMRDECVHA